MNINIPRIFQENLELTETYELKIKPTRGVPFAFLQLLKLELNKMKSLDIVSKVTETPEWVNSMVLINKKNSKSMFRFTLFKFIH